MGLPVITEGEGGVVLGVEVLAPEEADERLESARLHDAGLVVHVLRQAAHRKGGHLSHLDALLQEHGDQGAQGCVS